MRELVVCRLSEWPLAEPIFTALRLLGVPEHELAATVWCASEPWSIASDAPLSPPMRAALDALPLFLAPEPVLRCVGGSTRDVAEVRSLAARDGWAVGEPRAVRDLKVSEQLARFDHLLNAHRLDEVLRSLWADELRPIVVQYASLLIERGKLDTIDAQVLVQAAGRDQAAALKLAKAHRARVLSLERPSMDVVQGLHFASLYGAPVHRFDESELEQLGARWRAAIRSGSTGMNGFSRLHELDHFSSQAFIEPGELRHLKTEALRESLKTGALAPNHFTFGLLSDVAQVEVDLCLRALPVLVSALDEREVARRVEWWHRDLPLTGYSPQACREVSAVFSQPRFKRVLRPLLHLLTERGVVVQLPTPVSVESLDERCTVSTDVGYLVIGSEKAIARLEGVEEPEEWPGLIKKGKAVGVRTIGDGSYDVRVASRQKVSPAAEWVSVGVFPLEVADGVLVVSGVVGEQHSLSAPDGRYSAELLQVTSTSLVLLLTPTSRLPRWTHGDDVPWAGDL